MESEADKLAQRQKGGVSKPRNVVRPARPSTRGLGPGPQPNPLPGIGVRSDPAVQRVGSGPMWRKVH